MKKTNLPPLLGEPLIQTPTAVGRWIGNQENSLKKISGSLQVSGGWSDADEPVRAVPDPWAQARTFADALIDSNHTLHKTALAQWRGLLAVFALRTRKSANYILGRHECSLSGNSNFEAVLSTLTPEIGITPDVIGSGDASPTFHDRSNAERELWVNYSIYTVSDPDGRSPKPFAMSNPACLISPGRAVSSVNVPGAFWAENGLSDPLSSKNGKRLTSPEATLLKRWLEDLRGETNENVRSSGLKKFGESAEKIRQLLKEYIDDCAKFGIDPDLPVETGPSEHSSKSPELFRLIWGTVKEGESTRAPWERSRSRVKLGTAIPGVKGVIFADAALLDLPGVDAHNFRIWGDHVLEDVLSTPRKFEDLHFEMAAEGWWLISSRDLFTDRAVVLRNEPEISAHPSALKSMVLPVRPLTLLLSENLKSSVQGQVSGSQATISFTLLLEPENGTEPRKVIVKKQYSAEQEQVGDEGLLVNRAVWDFEGASYWPDFQSPSWETYLARFNNFTDDKAIMRGAVPRHGLSRGLLREVANLASEHEAIKKLQAVNQGEVPALPKESFRISQWLHSEGSRLEMLQKSRFPFDAFVYTEEKQSENRHAAFCGLVLTSTRTFMGQTRPAKVAVDFGTTTTIACVNDIDEDPITFRNRLQFPIRQKDKVSEAKILLNRRQNLSSFFPAEERQTPIDTVATAREPYDASETSWAFRNLIYFYPSQPSNVPDFGKQELQAFKSITANVRFDLKWSDDSRYREAAADYLEQFMTMVAAELYDSGYDPRTTEWLFSAPEAMSLYQRKQFQDLLQSHIDNISPESNTKLILCSEGISAARYMKLRGNLSSDGTMITLDIGGGTTDVTLWEREAPIWRGSIKLAGQDFFTKLLMQNPDILKNIGLSAWAEILASSSNGTTIPKADLANLADMLFSGRTSRGAGVLIQNPLEDALKTHWINRVMSKDGAQLRHTATVFIGGIAWYLGRVMRHLLDRQLLRPDMVSDVAFAVCGRGGGLFKRMHGIGERPEAKSPITQALFVFADAADLTEVKRPEFASSPAAKLEVVRGMLADYEAISPYMDDLEYEDKKRFASHDMLNGLSLKFRSGRAVTSQELLYKAAADDKIESVDISELELFLEALSKKTGLKVTLSETGLSRLKKDLREELDRAILAAARDNQPREMEPPFVTALRILIMRMAAPATEREGLLETTESAR